MLPDPLNYELSLQLRACQSRSRRNGKVARLPAALRGQINQMLDEGFPYKTIIQVLGSAGQHLNEDNLSNWRLGGYQDYLKAQAINERAHCQTQAAADVVRESGDLSADKLRQACSKISLLQCFDTILELGDQCAAEGLKKNPEKYISFVNTCCKLR